MPFSSSCSRLRTKQWSLLATALVFLPLVATYWSIFRWLAAEQCILYRPIDATTNSTTRFSATAAERTSTTNRESSIGGLVCQGRSTALVSLRSQQPYVIDLQSPPSIARLVTAIANPSDEDNGGMGALRLRPQRQRQRQLQLQRRATETMYHPEEQRFDYGNDSPWSMAALFGILGPPRSTESHREGDSQKTNTETYADTGYGFRRNPNHRSGPRSVSVPVATYLWLAINVGLYAWYWHHKVDPSTVALDGSLLGLGSSSSSSNGNSNGNSNSDGNSDFGRALSGNLAHFEIWHLGLNAMSLMSLGESLEITATLVSGGSIGMVLWTASFLALTTLVVVGGHLALAKLRTGVRQPQRFPSMVGFSGILFCWSVATALSLPESAAICPIPVLTSVCFETHRSRNGWSFSWAPLVQLAMVQMVLPRASFAGHLSGLTVGFLWHWKLLPPLDWSQPCVSYPVLWAVGKYGLHRWGADPEAGGTANPWWSDPAESNRYGDGHVLGASSSSSSSNNNNIIGSSSGSHHRWGSSSESRDESLRAWLRVLRSALGIHWIGMALTFRRSGLLFLGCWDSIAVSELLLVLLFSLLVRAKEATGSGGSHGYGQGYGYVHGHDSHAAAVDSPWASVGILGRAYVAFALIALVTDSMTIGGWWATGSGPRPWSVGSFLFVLRLALWVLSISTACHVLDRSNELQRRSQTTASAGSINRCGGGGIWTHVLGWSVLIDPCASLGSTCVAAWTRSAYDSSSSSLRDFHTIGGGIALGSSTTTTNSGSERPDRRELSARRAKLFSAKRNAGAASTRRGASETKSTTGAASGGSSNANANGNSSGEDASALV